MTSEKKCEKLEAAYELINELEMIGEIPPDYDPGDYHREQILAEIRHEYTNYEQLLQELPECKHCLEPQCVYAEMAHDQLKRVARNIAQRAYSEWCDRKKKGA